MHRPAAACCARARPPATQPTLPGRRPGSGPHRLGNSLVARVHRSAPPPPLHSPTPSTAFPPPPPEKMSETARRRSRSRSPLPPRRPRVDEHSNGTEREQVSRGASPGDGGDGQQARLAPATQPDDHHLLLRTAPLVAGVATARGARPYQEDRHVVVSPFVVDRPLFALEEGTPSSPPPPRPHCDYFAVFDGHSGADAAEHAAARLHGLLARDPVLRGSQHTAADDVAELGPAVAAAMRACFHAVDAEILARARTSGGREGATALVALRMGVHLFTAHAGDARAVLRRAGGLAHRLTHDHKPSDPGERARVEAAGGRVEHLGCWRVVSIPTDPARLPAGLAISRSLGDLDFKGGGGDGSIGAGVTADPTVGRTTLDPADNLLILASDGLWDVLSDQQACDIAGEVVARVVRERSDSGDDEGGEGDGVLERAAHAAARALVAAALARRSMDNITALCAVMPWAHGVGAGSGVVVEGQAGGAPS